MLELIQNFAGELAALNVKSFHIAFHTPEYSRLKIEIAQSMSKVTVEWAAAAIKETDGMTRAFDINISGLMVHVSEIRTISADFMSIEEYNKRSGL